MPTRKDIIISKNNLKNKPFFILCIVIIIVIFALTIINKLDTNLSKTSLIEKYKLNNLSSEEIVETLDRNNEDYQGLSASITGEKLKLSDGKTNIELNIPKDKFYLSFAPYINNTHPCKKHNLISCRSELVNEKFFLKIVDNFGKKLIEKEVYSMANGFIGIWLPKNFEGVMEVHYNGLVASTKIDTFRGSNTCLTTPLKLR